MTYLPVSNTCVLVNRRVRLIVLKKSIFNTGLVPWKIVGFLTHVRGFEVGFKIAQMGSLRCSLGAPSMKTCPILVGNTAW